MQNDISIDTLKDILMNLKPSDYRMSFVDLGAKEDEKIQIFMPTYNNKVSDE